MANASFYRWMNPPVEPIPHFQVGRTRMAEGEATGLRALIRNHPRQLVAVMLLTAGGTIAFYTFTTYSLKYMVNTAGISKADAATINFFALLVFLFMQPAMGALSDRIGRRRVLMGLAIGAVLFTAPILTAMGSTTNPWEAFLLMVLALAFLSGYIACGAIVKAEVFPTHVWAVGVGLPYATGGAVLGGSTESVALGLKAAGHEGLFGWYVTGFTALTFIALIMMKGSFTRNTIDAASTDDLGEVEDSNVENGSRKNITGEGSTILTGIHKG